MAAVSFASFDPARWEQRGAVSNSAAAALCDPGEKKGIDDGSVMGVLGNI